MAKFTGTYYHTMDAKGRVFIPSKLRDNLGESFIITAGLDGCLYLATSERFEGFAEKLESLPMDEDSRTMQRYFLRYTTECEIDKQGRIVIPANLKELAKLTKDVVFIGVSNKIELWDKERIETENFDKSMNAIIEKVSKLHGLSF